MVVEASDDRDWKRKIDHRLTAAIDRAAGDWIASPVVPVFIRFRGDVRDLQTLGCTVRAVAGDVAVANISLAEVSRVANSPSVLFIELGGTASLD
jgi:hypothetical protein